MLFMIIVIGTGIGLGADDVLTAQFSQGICVPILLLLWGFAWLKFNPKVEAKRPLPDEGNTNLVKAGFVQVYHTAKKININYKNSIRWYMIALCFAEAGANSFTVCAVTYLNEVVKMDGIETGISFFIVLLFTIPGAKVSERVAKRTNFNTSWRMNMVRRRRSKNIQNSINAMMYVCRSDTMNISFHLPCQIHPFFFPLSLPLSLFLILCTGVFFHHHHNRFLHYQG